MSATTPTAVVGHIESVEFLVVPELPVPGEVIGATDAFRRAAGGGGVAAAALATLGAPVSLFCALGDDPDGDACAAQLTERGVEVHVARRRAPTRRAVTLLRDGGERTIVTIGERLQPHGSDPLPWERLDACGAVYVTAGDAQALAQARRAKVLVATPRARDALSDGPRIDVLVYSHDDPAEREWARRLEGRARVTVATEGSAGGRWWGESSGRWEPVAPPGPVRDTYGAGDTFAAVLTYALGEGSALPAATAVAAQWGAAALTHQGSPW